MTIREQIEGSTGIEPSRVRDLVSLLERMAGAGRQIAREVRRAALSGELGYSGGENITGDRQKKLDVAGNDLVLEAFRKDPLVSAIISEEDDLPVATASPDGPYVLCTDPIDGSSNTDVDGALGTIFSFSRRRAGSRFPQGGDIAAAGYVLYGPSTLLAYSAGAGVAGFTLDEDKGAFVLTHPAIRCPRRGRTFSANLGNQRLWHPNLQVYLRHVTEEDKPSGRPYSLRYAGALVADLHRCLIEGGLYFYPKDAKHQNGKLRLLYECAPLAFLTEQAGGRATDGDRRILEVEAAAAHQRSPLVIGSADEVALFDSILMNGRPPEETRP